MPHAVRTRLFGAGAVVVLLSGCQGGSSTAASDTATTTQPAGSSSHGSYQGKRATPVSVAPTDAPSSASDSNMTGTPSSPKPGVIPTATITISRQYKVTVKNASEVLVPNLATPDSDPDARCSPYTAAEAGALARKKIAPPTGTSKNSWTSDDALSSFGCEPLNVVVVDNGAKGADARHQIALFHAGFYVGTPLTKPVKELPDVTTSMDGVIQFVDDSTAKHGATMTSTTDPLGEEHEYPEGTTVNYYVWDSHSGKVLLTHEAPQLAN